MRNFVIVVMRLATIPLEDSLDLTATNPTPRRIFLHVDLELQILEVVVHII